MRIDPIDVSLCAMQRHYLGEALRNQEKALLKAITLHNRQWEGKFNMKAAEKLDGLESALAHTKDLLRTIPA